MKLIKLRIRFLQFIEECLFLKTVTLNTLNPFFCSLRSPTIIGTLQICNTDTFYTDHLQY